MFTLLHDCSYVYFSKRVCSSFNLYGIFLFPFLFLFLSISVFHLVCFIVLLPFFLDRQKHNKADRMQYSASNCNYGIPYYTNSTDLFFKLGLSFLVPSCCPLSLVLLFRVSFFCYFQFCLFNMFVATKSLLWILKAYLITAGLSF